MIDEPSWNWEPQGLLFLGSNGLLTQTAPTSGMLFCLGFAVTETRAFIRPRDPIILN
jgi:hypothetical protein